MHGCGGRTRLFWLENSECGGWLWQPFLSPFPPQVALLGSHRRPARHRGAAAVGAAGAERQQRSGGRGRAPARAAAAGRRAGGGGRPGCHGWPGTAAPLHANHQRGSHAARGRGAGMAGLPLALWRLTRSAACFRAWHPRGIHQQVQSLTRPLCCRRLYPGPACSWPAWMACPCCTERCSPAALTRCAPCLGGARRPAAPGAATWQVRWGSSSPSCKDATVAQ